MLLSLFSSFFILYVHNEANHLILNITFIHILNQRVILLYMIPSAQKSKTNLFNAKRLTKHLIGIVKIFPDISEALCSALLGTCNYTTM